MIRPFPFLTVHTIDGDVSVPCEPIGTHFAITPEFAMTEDGKALLLGTFLVSLYPSGVRLSEGAGCIRCARGAALRWEKLPLDWAGLTADNGEQWPHAQPADAKHTFAMERDLFFNCDTGYCEPDKEDARSWSYSMGDTIFVD